MSKEVYRIDIPIETTDKYTPGLKKARDDVSKFEKEASRMERRMNRMNRQRWEMTIRARDRASQVISSINTFARRVTSRTYKMTIRAVDMVTRPLRGIISAASSAFGMLGMVGGVAGGVVVPLKVTMDRQNITTAFEVLLGSADKAKQRIDDLIDFAGQTPYTRDEIFQASRVLEVFTKGALSTGDGLRMVGDIAAGTQQPFEDVALWMGRLYDAMGAGRPVGEMTSRLQEMGAISGDARARIEKLAESGGDIKKIWPRVTKEFERYNGMMGKMSGNLSNLLLGVKSFFMNNVIARWGNGLTKAITPSLEKFRQWRKDNKKGIEEMGTSIEKYGEKFTRFFVDRIGKGASYVEKIFFSDKYKNLTFGAKVRLMIDDANNAFSDWWEKTGRDQVTGLGKRSGKTIGNTAKNFILGILGVESDGGASYASAGFEAGSTFVKSFIDAFDAGKIVSEIGKKLADINIKGITGPFKGEGFGGLLGAGFVDLLVLGMASRLLSGPMRAGRGLLKGGKKAFDWTKGAGKGEHKGGRWLKDRIPTRSRRPRHISSSERTRLAKAEMEAARRYSKSPQAYRPPKDFTNKLGTKGMSKIPFLRTGLNLLSLSTASDDEIPGLIGSIAGGVAGAKGGAMAGAAIGSVIPGVGTAVGGIIGGIGGAIGGEWLGRHWDTIKEKASETASWVSTKFEETKVSLSNSIFNGGWWSSKWENVMSWTSEKWNSSTEIWNNVVSNIDETLFNGEWWMGHWDSVKSWASEKVNSFSDVWESARSSAESTLFSADWWSGKWGQVKSWASSAWENIKSGFNLGREQGGQTSRSPKKYANGGYVNRPHLGLVGEAGPEMIIPLSSGRRNRAFELYQRTGQMLGVKQYANGGLVGKEPLPIPSTQNNNGGVTVIFEGGINPSFSIKVDDEKLQFNETLAMEFANFIIKVLTEKLKEAAKNTPISVRI